MTLINYINVYWLQRCPNACSIYIYEKMRPVDEGCMENVKKAIFRIIQNGTTLNVVSFANLCGRRKYEINSFGATGLWVDKSEHSILCIWTCITYANNNYIRISIINLDTEK